MERKMQDFVKNLFTYGKKEEIEEEISEDDEIGKEFQEMKRNFQRFIEPLPKIVKEIDRNVFYNVVNDQRTKERLVNMARETRPILAKETWDLLDDYMDFLRNLPGIEGENYRAVYANLNRQDFVKRLLFKRPIVFCGRMDYYILRHDGKKIIEGDNAFYNVAECLNKPRDAGPYLKEYISYDENLMSSLIGMSTPTFYFSIGSGRFALNANQPHIDEGILCGLVGARHGKLNFMEHRFTFPRIKDSTITCHKSDEFWIEKVYSEAFPEKFVPTVEDIEAKPEIYRSIYVDGVNEVFLEKRLTLSILPFIQEAMTRGIEKDKGIFCSVPPIGAGCWAIGLKREIVHRLIVTGILKFLDKFDDMKKLKYLKALCLPQLDVQFYSSFKVTGSIKDIKIKSNEIILRFKTTDHEIKVINEQRYVAELLPDDFKDCISIAGFAWDGNSFPGNEYWSGNYGSFDPKAVYCSLLGQFQNPEVNVKMADPERIRIY